MSSEKDKSQAMKIKSLMQLAHDLYQSEWQIASRFIISQDPSNVNYETVSYQEGHFRTHTCREAKYVGQVIQKKPAYSKTVLDEEVVPRSAFERMLSEFNDGVPPSSDFPNIRNLHKYIEKMEFAKKPKIAQASVSASIAKLDHKEEFISGRAAVERATLHVPKLLDLASVIRLCEPSVRDPNSLALKVLYDALISLEKLPEDSVIRSDIPGQPRNSYKLSTIRKLKSFEDDIEALIVQRRKMNGR